MNEMQTSVPLTCHDEKFNSRSEHSPEVVIHTQVYLSAQTAADWARERFSLRFIFQMFVLLSVLF